MKKILTIIIGATMLTITTYAQMANSDLLIDTDHKRSKNMPVGLDERVTIATDQPIEWSKSQYGYAGSYMLGDTPHMATFNNQSHYVDTYHKIDWNDSEVSSIVKSSFLTSHYKDQQVISYWESSDPDENGYYLEIKDKAGKQSGIWADVKGNFYDRPYEYRITLTGTE